MRERSGKSAKMKIKDFSEKEKTAIKEETNKLKQEKEESKKKSQAKQKEKEAEKKSSKEQTAEKK
jgi:hypothetical protein